MRKDLSNGYIPRAGRKAGQSPGGFRHSFSGWETTQLGWEPTQLAVREEKNRNNISEFPI